MEVRGSRQNEGCELLVEGLRKSSEGSQRRSLSSSCMVFLMRRSMVVSHWSNREMVSYSFTWNRNGKYKTSTNWAVRCWTFFFAGNIFELHHPTVIVICLYSTARKMSTHRISIGVNVLFFIGVKKFLVRLKKDTLTCLSIMSTDKNTPWQLKKKADVWCATSKMPKHTLWTVTSTVLTPAKRS